MRVGEATLVTLGSINWTPPGCGPWTCPSSGDQVSFHSSSPAVARIEKTSFRGTAVVKAQSVGETQIYADKVRTAAGRVRAPLAYCDDPASCDPIELVLRVLP